MSSLLLRPLARARAAPSLVLSSLRSVSAAAGGKTLSEVTGGNPDTSSEIVPERQSAQAAAEAAGKPRSIGDSTSALDCELLLWRRLRRPAVADDESPNIETKQTSYTSVEDPGPLPSPSFTRHSGPLRIMSSASSTTRLLRAPSLTSGESRRFLLFGLPLRIDWLLPSLVVIVSVRVARR